MHGLAQPSSGAQDSESARPSGEWLTIAALCFVEIAGTGSSALIYAATPMFVLVFSDPKLIGWMSSLYFIVGAVAAGVCGGIGDLYGRRATLMWVLGIVAVAGIVGGSVSDPHHIVAVHAIQGVGIAVPTLTMGLIRESIQPRGVPVAIAIVTTAITASAGLFFMLAGHIMDHQSWRYIFYFGPLIVVPAMFILLFFVPNSVPKEKPSAIPLLNGLLFGLGALFLMLAVGELTQSGFTSRSLTLLAGAVAFTLAWIWDSTHRPVPMVDVRIVAARGAACILVVYALLSLTVFQFGHVLLFVGKAQPVGSYGGGLTNAAVTAMMLPQGVLGLLIGPFTGNIVRRFGHFNVFLTVLCVIGIPYLVLVAFSHSHSVLLATAILAGITGGAQMPVFRIALQEEVDATRASSAMGLAELVRALFMGLGAQIVASTLVRGQSAASAGVPLDPTRFRVLMMGFIAAIALAALVYLLGGSRKGKIADA
jgi:MFS family permease